MFITIDNDNDNKRREPGGQPSPLNREVATLFLKRDVVIPYFSRESPAFRSKQRGGSTLSQEAGGHSSCSRES